MKRSILYLCLSLTLLMGVATSCGDEDYIIEEPIVGQWRLLTINNMLPATETDYVFYGNFTGYIYYNVGYPNQWSAPFEWDVQTDGMGRSFVYMYLPGEQLTYRYTITVEPIPGTGVSAYILNMVDLDTGDILKFQEYSYGL